MAGESQLKASCRRRAIARNPIFVANFVANFVGSFVDGACDKDPAQLRQTPHRNGVMGASKAVGGDYNWRL
jgi:hypothetical protein